MKGENHSGVKYQDIALTSTRHPLIVDLQTALIAKKPANPIHFIKFWAMKQLKQVGESQEEKETQQMKVNEPKKKMMNDLLKRRGAIVMLKIEQNQHWKQFYLKDQLNKNKKCKSRIMIGLRSVPFLHRVQWEDITYLAEFVSKGHRNFILILGQIKRHNQKPPSTIYSQGSYLFAESLISSLKAVNNYLVTSEKAWICGIEAHAIHERLRVVNLRRRQIITCQKCSFVCATAVWLNNRRYQTRRSLFQLCNY